MPPEKTLDENNRAHVCVYTYLRNKSYANDAFEDVGKKEVQYLSFYPVASSDKPKAAVIAVVALSLARYTQQYYTKQHQGLWAQKKDAEILSAIAGLLMDGSKTVFDLAEKIDEIYLFPGEKNDDSILSDVEKSLIAPAG